MRALTASELLGVWERGLLETPPRRALTLLAAAASDELSPEALARLSVGERDARLLTLREQTFGSRLTSLATCPACQQRVESEIEVNDLRVATGGDAPATLALSAEGYDVQFRLPNSLDLEAIAGAADKAREGVNGARDILLERCLLSAEREGERVEVRDLPDEVFGAIVERMQGADPQADVRLALACPQCDARWEEQFDIEAFFWDEINAWAERLLREVHTIASRYGWRETDILNMTASRRHYYLDLING